ncbi:hypothetical protein PVT68_07320 [Microbulbifer bruguierae]|uniref:Phage holin family protein n=1 Tax=Microbulbifer bruguierae TaxID=3029061 RepID=A0ABY8NGP8_9GAMM|nr:hypothetical protein [Microbulbifer bruguierae]WGL18096.1 hypothetical protein PVT68_07320 [Microbulbifer bruguierae]
MAAHDKSKQQHDASRASAQSDPEEESSFTDPAQDCAGVTEDFHGLLERAEATMTLATAWAENYSSLVRLEFQRTLGAGKRIVVLLLLLFFLAIALIESLCAGAGLLGYYFFNSIYIGFGIFVLAQLLIVTALLLSLRKLRALLGFEESRKQAQQALNDVSALFKQAN